MEVAVAKGRPWLFQHEGTRSYALLYGVERDRGFGIPKARTSRNRRVQSMQTILIHAPMPVLKHAVERLKRARMVPVPGGTVAVQSPDFERMELAELKAFVQSMTMLGMSAELLEEEEALRFGE